LASFQRKGRKEMKGRDADNPDTPGQKIGDFSFKPALLVGRLHFTLGEEALVCTNSHGAEKWQLGWADITKVAFVEHKVKASRMRRLDLMTAKRGDKQSISYTGGLGNPAADPDGVAQLDLMAAILERLAARDREFQVIIGECGGARVAIFAIGLASIVGATGLAALVVSTGVSQDRMAAGSVPALMLVLLGAGLTYTHAPWRDVPQAAALVFADALQLIAHPDADGV
jgi:hypothetical protein